MIQRFSDPIAVEATRGGMVESRHRVDAALVDADGRIVAAFGDPAKPVFSRSSAKPIQALPFLESGAADDSTDAEIALACASHGGEAVHTTVAGIMLARAGLDMRALECGVHWPSHEPSMRALVRRGEAPCALHNNCSGKHAGFVATAAKLGESVAGYVHADHPVQRRVTAALEAMTGESQEGRAIGIDGCSIPTIAFSLAGMARAWARFANPTALAPARAACCRRVYRAMTAEPAMVAGTDRHCTALLAAGRGRIVAKTGAEGYYAAAIPERGFGIALKAEDGATRAAEAAITALLRRFGGLDDEAWARLGPRAAPPIVNRRGIVTGALNARVPGYVP
jgi:L-asparaginase II